MVNTFFIEQRQHKRHDVNIAGVLIIDGRHYDCLVKDLSLGGARIALNDARVLPERLKLLELESRSAFECMVRWQNNAEAGLSFIDLCTRSERRSIIDRLVAVRAA